MVDYAIEISVELHAIISSGFPKRKDWFATSGRMFVKVIKLNLIYFLSIDQVRHSRPLLAGLPYRQLE